MAEGYDAVKGELFYRPLGGGIELGEYAEQTLIRELREEIGVEVFDLRYLFTLENIFTYNGTIGHEIVLVFDGQLAQATLYAQALIKGRENNGTEFTALWKKLDEFADAGLTLYPTGLLEKLRVFERQR